MKDRALQNNALVELSLALLRLHCDTVRFVQIGANDGKHGDPIYAHVRREKWAGYLFEPVPFYYDKLVENYAQSSEVQCFNMAISDTRTQMEIHYLDPTHENNAPGWARAIASLDRSHISRHVKDEYILTQTVDCVPFGDFADHHDIREVDLFVIDVEGHEGAVCRSIDLDRFKPKLILLEYCHTPQEDVDEICAQFERFGLTILKGVKDLVAFDAKLLTSIEGLRAALSLDAEKGVTA